MKQIRVVDRALNVIETLSANGPLSLVQLRAKTDLDNATLLRILSTMIARGWVRKLLVEKKYELSHALGTILGAESRAHPIAELAAPVLLELKSNALGLPSDLAAIVGPGLFEIVESSRLKGPMAPVRTGLGLRPSLFKSAHGRAILAALPEEAQNSHIQAYMNRAARDEMAWYHTGGWDVVLQETIKRGFGLRENLYWEPPFDDAPPFGALAIPIQTRTDVYGSISFIWLSENFGLEDILQAGLLNDLKQAAQAIAVKLSQHEVPAPAIT